MELAEILTAAFFGACMLCWVVCGQRDRAEQRVRELTIDKLNLKALIRDWLDACPETCGQCEHVHKAAEEAVR